MNDELAIQWVSGVIRSEMKKRGLNYVNLMDRLDAMGVKENERNLRNKVARGTFSAVFFVQCLEALGVRNLKIDMAEYVRDASTKPGHNDETAQLDPLGEIDEMRMILDKVKAIIARDDDAAR